MFAALTGTVKSYFCFI